MSAWTCVACGTHNDPASHACLVCGGSERAGPDTPTRRFVPVPPVHPPAAPRPARTTPPRATPPRAAPPRAAPPRATRPRAAPPRATPPSAPPRIGITPPPVVTAPRRSSQGPTFALVAVLLAAVVGTIVVTTRDGDAEESPGATGTTYDTPATSDPATESTTAETTTAATAGPAGLVAIDQPGDLADRVATMFETYFAGINAKDPDAALSVVEPKGRMNPADPAVVAKFGADIRTTRDDEIELGAVTDNGGTVTAELSFRSRQAAGYGPADDPDQTCTRWTMVYTLADSGAGLRIRDVDAQHEAC
ncbi:hypothetical protein [Actinoplanes octamycinicus]|uniref:hypothetical protein n=1 Tax=Actinoplanes octamycinicus TaxID=135948 RepID=UPI001941B4F8|nr:hypothetical protein [Actinoplanes octamycinicus]